MVIAELTRTPVQDGVTASACRRLKTSGYSNERTLKGPETWFPRYCSNRHQGPE
jgi:hypothetical protein